MKTRISLLIMMLYTGWLFAAPRTPQQALDIARAFIGSNVAMKHIGASQLKVAHSGEAITRSNTTFPAYYIINAENNSGFVIISGDDNAREVLAYSDEGSLNLNQLPTNVKYWLDFYTAEIAHFTPEDATATNQLPARTASTRATPPVITPLLDDIKWDQGDPYNLMCPEANGERTVTGCAATALAIVMKYYGYPQQGTGSYSYTTTSLKRTLSANFGETTYKWDLMLPQYTASATDGQKAAVAELMLHCGIAMDMDYNVSSAGGSGAGIFKQYNALTKYFGYNPNIYFEGRDYNSEGRWKNMIQNELLAGRPVLYNGQSTGGGHAFILDGCDEKDMYHFNWGWGGYANGYYSLSALNPGSGGIGSGSGAYNDMQYILLLVQPQVTGEVISGFTTDGNVSADKAQYGRDENISVEFTQIWNTATSMSGVIGLALYQGDDFITFLTAPSTVSNLDMGSGWNRISFSGTVPASVPNGTYQLHFASQKDGERVPHKLRGAESTNTAYSAEISTTDISLSSIGSNPNLYQLAPAQLVGEAIEGQDLTFTVQIENRGATYEDDFAIYIRRNGALLPYTHISSYAALPSNSSETLTISGNPGLPAGEYYAIGSYRRNGDWRQFTGTDLRLVFTIKDVETGIEQTESTRALKVIATSTGLNISSENIEETIEVYTSQGMKIAGIKGGQASVELSQSGLYIIRQGKEILKVMFKAN